MPIDPVILIPPRPPKREVKKWHQTWWAPWLVFVFGATFLIIGAVEAKGDRSTARQYMVIVGLIAAAWFLVDLYLGWRKDGIVEVAFRLRYPLVAAVVDDSRSTRMGMALLALVMVAAACGIYVGLTNFTALVGKPP